MDVLIKYFNKHLKNKALVFFLSSVFVHIFLIFIFSFLNGNSKIKPESIYETVEITLIETPPTRKSTANTSAKSTNPASKNQPQSTAESKTKLVSNSKPIKLNFTGKSSSEIMYDKLVSNKSNDLLRPSNSKSYFKDNQFRPTKDNYDSFDESGAHGYLEKGGIAKIFEQNPFYSALWSKVRGLTGFPQDFVNYRLKGQVRIHALVDSKGVMIGDFLKVSSSNPILELYSMAILVNAMRTPLHKSNWSKDKQIPIVFEFNFNHVQNQIDEVRLKSNFGYFNANIFKFNTARYIPSDVEQFVIDFYRDYLPPVIIIPGGVLIDVAAAYDKYLKWKNKDFRLSKKIRKDNAVNLRKELLLALKYPSDEIIKNINSKVPMQNFNSTLGGADSSILNPSLRPDTL